jgi:iron complex transport system substrate-binding protein
MSIARIRAGGFIMKVNFVIVLCAVLALGSVFPGAKKQADSSAAGIGETITVTDLAGRNVVIKTPVKKVSINWTGSGGAFMSMSALLGKDAGAYISSWDGQLQDYYFDRWEHYRSAVPGLESIPVIGSIDMNDFNLEMLINLKPDLVIWTLGVRQQAMEAVEPALAKAGIPVVYIDYHAETTENHSKTTRLLGKIFGKEERAEEIIDFYVKNMNLIESRLGNLKEKPVAYVERAGGGPGEYGNSYPNNYMWGAMVVKAGGTNLAEGRVVNYGPLEPELLITKNPDCVIFTGSHWSNPESMRMGYLANSEETQRILGNFIKRPGWDSLAAVKNKRIYAINHGLGREIYDVAAIAFLAKCIHPDIFADLDPMAMLKDYYNRFMPYDISGVWMIQIE